MGLAVLVVARADVAEVGLLDHRPRGEPAIVEQLQAEHGLYDGRDHQATVAATAQDTPHVLHAEVLEPFKEVEIKDPALVTPLAAIGEAQTAVCDPAVEEDAWVGNLHLLVVGIDVVDHGIQGRARVHVGARGARGGEVGRSCQVVVAGLGLHGVGHKHVLASCQATKEQTAPSCHP